MGLSIVATTSAGEHQRQGQQRPDQQGRGAVVVPCACLQQDQQPWGPDPTSPLSPVCLPGRCSPPGDRAVPLGNHALRTLARRGGTCAAQHVLLPCLRGISMAH